MALIMSLKKILNFLCLSMCFNHLYAQDVALQVIPNEGSFSVPVTLPGVTNIFSMLNSGESVWALGSSAANNVMSVNTQGGPSDWQTVAYPFSSKSSIFVPAYPETGLPATGFASDGVSQVAYFDGKNFEPVTTFSGNLSVNVYASSGNAWMLVSNASAVSVSEFRGISSVSNAWSALQVLPKSVALSTAGVVASANALYILPANTTQPSLIKVNTTGNIQSLAFPTLPLAPIKVVLLAQGETLFAFLIAQTVNASPAYAYYSKDGGHTWVNVTQGLPVINAFLISQTVASLKLVNNVVIFPPYINGNGVNGVYLNLAANTPAWSVYPFPSNGTDTSQYSNISADGQEQCMFTEPEAPTPVVDCFNFAQGQWLTIAAIPANAEISQLTSFVLLGNNKIIALGVSQNSNNEQALYYDGQNWTITSMSNVIGAKFSSSFGATYNPNNLWAFGLGL